MEIKHIIGKKEFVLNADLEGMLETLNELKGSWQENYYTQAGTVDYYNVTEEDFLNDIADMENTIKDFINNPDKLKVIIENMPKKKNGTFYGRSRRDIDSMEMVSTYHTDFTNSWHYYKLVVRVVSDLVCNMTLGMEWENQ